MDWGDAGEFVLDAHKTDSEIAARATYGYIVDYGPTAWLRPELGGEPPCREGDYVCYARHGGKFVEFPGDQNKYIVIQDEDVLFIMKEKEDV